MDTGQSGGVLGDTTVGAPGAESLPFEEDSSTSMSHRVEKSQRSATNVTIDGCSNLSAMAMTEKAQRKKVKLMQQ